MAAEHVDAEVDTVAATDCHGPVLLSTKHTTDLSQPSDCSWWLVGVEHPGLTQILPVPRPLGLIIVSSMNPTLSRDINSHQKYQVKLSSAIVCVVCKSRLRDKDKRRLCLCCEVAVEVPGSSCFSARSLGVPGGNLPQRIQAIHGIYVF